MNQFFAVFCSFGPVFGYFLLWWTSHGHGFPKDGKKTRPLKSSESLTHQQNIIFSLNFEISTLRILTTNTSSTRDCEMYNNMKKRSISKAQDMLQKSQALVITIHLLSISFPSPFGYCWRGGGGCVVSETFRLLLGVVVLGPIFVSAGFPLGLSPTQPVDCKLEPQYSIS